MSDDVTEFAHRQRLGDRARRRERMREVVEPIRDRRVLHNVALVQNVGPGWWDGYDELVCVVGGDFRSQ